METLLLNAVKAIASIVATKALEKPSEEAGEYLLDKIKDKIKKFLSLLKKQSPDTLTAIEQASEKPLDYGEVVREVESAARANSEVKESMEELADYSEKNPPQNFAEILEEIKKAIEQSSHPFPPNFIQNIQKAINVAKEMRIDKQDIKIDNF